jgi:hypothetical protein
LVIRYTENRYILKPQTMAIRYAENMRRGILGFGTWVGALPNFRVFLLGEGGFPPPIVTNPDVISYAHLFPSEGIEMMSGFTNCTSK